MIKSKQVKTKLLQFLNGALTVPVYLDRAPDNSDMPYMVAEEFVVKELSDGDEITFTLEIFIDETENGAAEDLEQLCDDVRNNVVGQILSGNNFDGYITFIELSDGKDDKEFDLENKNFSLSLRVFYY